MPYTFHRYAQFFYLLSDEKLTMYQDPRQVLFYAAAPIFIAAFWSILEAIYRRMLGENQRRPAPVFPNIVFRLVHIYFGFKVVDLVLCLGGILQGATYQQMSLTALDLWIESIVMEVWFVIYVLFILWLAEFLIVQDTLARMIRREWRELHRTVGLDLPILVWH